MFFRHETDLPRGVRSLVAIGGNADIPFQWRQDRFWTQTGHGVTIDKIVSAARPHKSTIRLVEGCVSGCARGCGQSLA